MGTESIEVAAESIEEKIKRKPHKGRQLGVWAKALNECLLSLRRDVGYVNAAQWLGYNHYQLLPDFLDNYYVGMPEKTDSMCLVKLVTHNGKAGKHCKISC